MSTIEKIRSFGNFPVGWSYGQGKPATSEAMRLAESAERLLRESGYPETDAFFGEDGEIDVSGYLNGICASIVIRLEPYTDGPAPVGGT